MGRMRHPRRWGPSIVLAGAVAALAVATAFAGTELSPRSARALGVTELRSVSIDVARKRQRWDGFGMSERVWADPHLSNSPTTKVSAAQQASILRDLYTRLGLTRVRPLLDQGVQKERGASFAFGGKLADDHIAFVKQARRFGLKTFFPAPVYLEPWMKPDDPKSYVDWAMTMLQYWRSQGLEPPLYAPLNEPKIAGDFPPQWLHDVVVQLGRRLDAEGFRTQLVIPDDENPVDAYRRAESVLADPAARRYVGAVAFHIYRGGPDDWAKLRRLAGSYGLPLWMTEYTNKSYGTWPGALEWATALHGLITVGEVSAIDYLWGFFGSWVGGETLISMDFDSGVMRNASYSPPYWLTGQWSRVVRPGDRRVVATPAAGPVLTTAFVGARKLVIVAINTGAEAESVRFGIRGGNVLQGAVSAYRTSERESWRTLGGVRASRSGVTATLGPRSVTTFVLMR